MMSRKENGVQLGVPVALWSERDIQAYSNIKAEIEKAYPDLQAHVFSIQLPFSLEDEKRALQIANAKDLFVIHVQAPIEYENAITNYGPNLERTLELASHFNGNFVVNYHVGHMLSNQDEVNDYRLEKEKVWETTVRNFQRLADKAEDYNLQIAIENEPALFVKPVRGVSTIRPVIFPFGNMVILNKLLKDIGKRNVSLTFDTAHWAASQILPSFIGNQELLDEYFPGETLQKNIFDVFNCSSWEEFIAGDMTWTESTNIASTFHLSNTTGIGVHLQKSDAAKWGDDGTFEGILSKQQLNSILEMAKIDRKAIMLEMSLDLNNLDYHEILDFLNQLYR